MLLLLSPTAGPLYTGVGIDSALPEGDKVVTFSQIRAVFPLQFMVGFLLVWGFVIYGLVKALRTVVIRKRGWKGTSISWLLASTSASSIYSLMVFGIITPLYSDIPFIFAASFLIGLPMAIGTYPPLPKVAITKQAGATTDEDTNPTKGHLVAHSDGFWHLFDQHNDLLSIPDDQVLAVRTSRKAHMPPVGTEPSSKGTECQEEAKQEEEEVR